MRTKHLNFVSKGNPYQACVLWRRDGGASEVFNELYKKADDALKHDLIAAIPRIDSDVDEVVCRVPAKYFDDYVPITKSFNPQKDIKMDTVVDIDEAKVAESHIRQIAGRYRRLQSLLKSEEDPVAKAGQQGAAIVDLIIKSQAERLRKADPSLTEAQAYERAYMAPGNESLRRAENNLRHAAIGSSYRIEEPIHKAETSGNDLYKRAKEIQKRDGIHFEIALNKAVAELPEMMSLEPRDLGDFETGRDMTGQLDSGYPTSDEVQRLADEMLRAAKTGKNFDQAAAAYLAAQQRVEQAAREAAGVR